MPVKNIDIVLPVYNEEPGIERFNTRLFQVLAPLTGYHFHVIYVLDRSTDASFAIVKKLSHAHPNITVLHLSRRFGHQMSLVAGIDYCEGDAVIMMDCDLQHPPEVIPALLERYEEGFDIVHTVRTYPGDVPWSKRFLSKVFYGVQNTLSPVELRDGAADFRLISKKVAVVFKRQIREHNQFLRALFQWAGFNSTYVAFVSSPRTAGTTKYDVKRLVAFFIDGMLSFSKIPLRIAGMLGFAISCLGLFYFVYLVGAFILGMSPPGYTSLIAVVLLLGGLQLTVLGVIGEYLGTIFDEVKNRPLYIVDDIVNGGKTNAFDRRPLS